MHIINHVCFEQRATAKYIEINFERITRIIKNDLHESHSSHSYGLKPFPIYILPSIILHITSIYNKECICMYSNIFKFSGKQNPRIAIKSTSLNTFSNIAT